MILEKGCMVKMFKPWKSRPDSENTDFNATTFSKWYNSLIDVTQRLCILQEILNWNMRNISFSMNRHHTFVWPRHVNREHFHTRMLPLYLEEEAFHKEFMSCLGVKCCPRNSGMHYILSVDLLKKKDKEVGEGLSSGPEPKKPDALVQSDTEDKEEI
jgi:hypothetical protein